MNTLTVIVPFYNEEQFLSESIQRLLDNDIYEQIILIDDCSTDASPEIAKQYSNEYKKIEYHITTNNGGKGKALAKGFSLVTSSHVVIHDADLEYFPVDIVSMFDALNGHINSLVLGSRFIGDLQRDGHYARTYYANKIMSKFFSLVNLKNITDVATCYKLMPTKFVKDLDIKENGFSIEIELLSKYLKYNRSVIEVPISYDGRSYEEGKKIKTSDGFFYLLNTLKYRIFN